MLSCSSLCGEAGRRKGLHLRAELAKPTVSTTPSSHVKGKGCARSDPYDLSELQLFVSLLIGRKNSVCSITSVCIASPPPEKHPLIIYVQVGEGVGEKVRNKD